MSHLELLRYFGIKDLIDESTGASIWTQANAKLAEPDFSARGILSKQNVAVICTTDDPADSLEHHAAIAKAGLKTRVYPTFRPDAALKVNAPEAFNAWCSRLASAAKTDVTSFTGFLDALKQRHDFFHSLGGRLSDHGLEACFAVECSEKQAAAIFDKTRMGKTASVEETQQFGLFLMLYLGHLDAARGWTKQLHLGPLRNNNTKLRKLAGPDTGFDSIGDAPQAAGLAF